MLRVAAEATAADVAVAAAGRGDVGSSRGCLSVGLAPARDARRGASWVPETETPPVETGAITHKAPSLQREGGMRASCAHCSAPAEWRASQSSGDCDDMGVTCSAPSKCSPLTAYDVLQVATASDIRWTVVNRNELCARIEV